MQVFLFLLAYALATLGGKVFSKLCSNTVTENGGESYTLFMLINGLVACLFFAISGGFSISLNLTTILYSVAFALLVALSLGVTLVIYRYADVASVGVITGSMSLIGTTLVGVLFFSEEMDLRRAIRIAVLLVAVVFVFLENRKPKEEEKSQHKGGIILFLLLLLMIATTCLTTVITKLFAISDSVTDENSFFFFTNVILSAFSLLILLLQSLKKKTSPITLLSDLRPLDLLFMVANTVASNVGSLVGVLLLRTMDIAVYTPLTSALAIIAGALASIFFREKLGKWSYLALAIATLAVLI